MSNLPSNSRLPGEKINFGIIGSIDILEHASTGNRDVMAIFLT